MKKVKKEGKFEEVTTRVAIRGGKVEGTWKKKKKKIERK